MYNKHLYIINIIESIGIINKSKIFICLRDENDNYYPDNMLIFVILHEFSHVICKSVGHTDEFNAIFDEVLQLATEKGVYDPSQPIILDYCLYKPDI